ncbi:MAG: choline dehydrogenase [Alphaproteobacteria bacterium]|nr:choline dehydrogenase [Alphaproteobacteria bacterium]
MAGQDYDYIIVGAGSAGCVLAMRLGEDRDVRILVLEAGGSDNHPLIRVPLGVGKAWSAPQFNWNYHSEPEPNIDNRIVFHPRGKLIGGSSSINVMAYVRGHRIDFDRLPQLGLPGWSYADVLPYFMRAEQHADGADPFHGGDGPLKTRKTPARDPVFDAFVAAGISLGYKANPDYNGAAQEGFSRIQHTIGNGRRWSTAVGYLRPALARGNVTLAMRAHVERVVFEGSRAVGVEYRRNGTVETARARRDVILSGGAYNSPQLLMLSGVGPADHLRSVGIAPRIDLAGVGHNLWDHLMVQTNVLRTETSAFMKNMRLDRIALSFAQAWAFGTGFASMLPSIGNAFVRSTPDVEVPDLQVYCSVGGRTAREWLPVVRPHPPDTLSLMFCHVRAESRGAVTLRSADPAAPPRIFNNFLSTPYDRRALREGVKFVRRLAAAKPFEGLLGAWTQPTADIRTDDEIDAFVRRITTTIYHPAGTCKVGTDRDAVVDPSFKVRGTEGLRVIDASVFPLPIGGNINAPVIMFAEKAADILRGRPALAPAEV